MIGKLVAWAAGSVGVYEVIKWANRRFFKTVSMIQGHSYALVLNYTTDPPSPISQQTAQSVLDSQSPGHFNVLSAKQTPGVQSQIRQLALLVQLTAPSADFPASTFTTGWPVVMGTVTLASEADMGASTGVA